MDFLSKTGRSLQSLNVALAAAIHTRRIRTDDLDHYMVLTEQTIVERALQAVRATDAARFSTVITQINRLLQLTEHLACGRHKSDRYTYAPVLTSVSQELRRPVDFASKEDRVQLGRRLIDHLRV
jgi:hypothetical protein